MNHIFCGFPDKANSRLKRIYQVYNDNPNNIILLVDNTVIKCQRCLNTYLDCSSEQWFEKKRLGLNFSPEKIYDWNLLFDDDILSENRAYINYPSAFIGFKAIVFLVREKIRNNEIWSKVDIKTIKLGDNEVNALIDGKLELGVPLFKALEY